LHAWRDDDARSLAQQSLVSGEAMAEVAEKCTRCTGRVASLYCHTCRADFCITCSSEAHVGKNT
jgi:hypothetical protein